MVESSGVTMILYDNPIVIYVMTDVTDKMNP